MNNKVELIGYYGSDKVIALSAWTSTERELDAEKEARIPKMINMLWTNGHETPFEKGIVHFLVDTEIASHIHFLKHRISSFNGESARYKELKEDKYYIPHDWREKAGTVGEYWSRVLEETIQRNDELYHACIKELEPYLGRKRIKESARFFKTYASQLQGDVSFNMRSFANFQRLRNSEHAQLEIREVAQQMLDLVRAIPGDPFKHTIEAWK